MPLESVKKVADADFPTRWGHFRILGFEGTRIDPEPCSPGTDSVSRKIEGAVALVLGDIHSGPPVVRIHSQCLTGDVFGSLRCDCRLQLELALQTIAQAGAGILLYEQQEGRGIGLMAKLRAYELQDQGLDTVEANLRLGFKPDCREFELPAEILKLLDIHSVRLITNNPEKVEALESAGIRVVERISAEVEPLNLRALRPGQAGEDGPHRRPRSGAGLGPLRHNHLRGCNRLPHVPLGVLRGVYQQSCQRCRQAFASDSHRRVRRPAHDRIQAPARLLDALFQFVKNGLPIPAPVHLAGQRRQLLRAQRSSLRIAAKTIQATGDVPQLKGDGG